MVLLTTLIRRAGRKTSTAMPIQAKQMIEEMARDIVYRNFHRFREMVFEDARYFSTDMGRVKSRLYYNVAVYETGDTYFFIEIENLHRDRSHTYPNISRAVAKAIGNADNLLSDIREACMEPRYDF